MKKIKLAKILKSDVFKIAVSSFFFISAIILEQFWILPLVYALYGAAFLVAGGGVLVGAVRGIFRRDVFDEKLLMSIASVGAMLVGELKEGVAVMLFFLIGETFERMAVKRSRASIRSLMDICPDEACLLTDEGEETVDAEDVEVGDVIVIRPGERVPLDCVVIGGSADVDTSAMTGEAIPVSVTEGGELDSGYVVISGLLKCRTLHRAEESAAARVLKLVENAGDSKSREERFITKFSRYYTPTVVICAVLLALVPSLLGITEWSDSVYRALVFLVISCPCALVISVPMAFFGGIGGAASRGILYKGGNVFSAVARADTVAFDKTGTLTSGEFTVSEIHAVSLTESELISLAASAEYASNHPIARCIKERAQGAKAPDTAQEYAGEGIVARVLGREVGVGNIRLMQRLGAVVTEQYRRSGAVYVSLDGDFAGTISVSDTVKPEAKGAVEKLRKLGIKKTAILSGDRRENVVRVGEAVGIDEFCAELTPEEKYTKLEELIESSHGTVYIGDGINDAPSLARADVGISMGRIGQDSAIEASDVVIMTDSLMKIPEAVLIARKTLAIAKENIVFALGLKILILILGALGIANMWLAVFADVGVAVLAILNSMRALRYSERK